MKNRKNPNRPPRKWNDADRFAFATQKLRASSIPPVRFAGPTVDEWGDPMSWDADDSWLDD